jgi:hypothetical protein
MLTFKPNTIGSNTMDKKLIPIQPPINKITVKALIKIILLYSARKNKAKPILAYSTLYPLTNSLSASGKSNGALFVSARMLIKNKMNNGNIGNTKNIKY